MMPQVDLKDNRNKVIEKIELNEGIFGLEIRKDLLHEAVINYNANQRQGTHATKTRGMVSGGGKKPWRQKHTGRARHGSIRSPLWKGGGTTFGPQPRDYYYKMPKKQRRLALKTALSAKLKDEELTVIGSIQIDKPKTKDMVSLLKDLGLEEKTVIVLLPDKDDNIYLSARNIPGVTVMRASDINTYAVIVHNHILMTRGALNKIQEVWG